MLIQRLYYRLIQKLGLLNTMKIDFSKLPNFTVFFEDGQEAIYQVTSYAGAQIGCFAYQLTGIRASGNLYKNKQATTAKVPPWELTKELIEAICKYLVDSASGTTFVVMGDAINRGTPVKYPNLGPEGLPPPPNVYAQPATNGIYPTSHVLDTRKFVEYLIKFKIGTVYAGPIGRNRNHGSPNGFSLCQIWIWVPPTSKEIVIPDSAAVFNYEGTTREKWAEDVSKHWLKHYQSYLTTKETYDWDYLVKNAMHKDSPLFSSAMDY